MRLVDTVSDSKALKDKSEKLKIHFRKSFYNGQC